MPSAAPFRKRVMKSISLPAITLAVVALWPAAEAIAEDRSPGADEAVSAGQSLFNRSCAGYCHGRDGQQGRAPSLRGRDDLTDEQVHATIANGKRQAGKFMPAW